MSPQTITERLAACSLAIEVNHIVPILGRHSESGCHHHLDNLETLCKLCHLTVTAEQRAHGLLSRNAS